MLFRDLAAGHRIVFLGKMKAPPWKILKRFRETGLVRLPRTRIQDADVLVLDQHYYLNDVAKHRVKTEAIRRKIERCGEHQFWRAVEKMPRVIPHEHEVLRKLRPKRSEYRAGF